MNNSSLIMKSNDLQKRIYRKNNIFASPSTNIDNIVSGIGCQTVKSGGAAQKNFNLKIKLKNENSFKKLQLSTSKASNKKGVKSTNKNDALNQSNLSAPRDAYHSNNKVD
jgi:hypothetical protein